MTLDSHYTPDWLADLMVANIDGDVPQVVADFAAGGGSLLRAAERRFGDKSTYVATDSDVKAVAKLRTAHPRWLIGRLDMFAGNSRRSSPIWNGRDLHIEVALLNPPFSYRGGRYRKVLHHGREFRATPAVAFVALALERLQKGSQVLALLPLNALQGQRDHELMSIWRSQHKVDELADFDRTVFDGAFARTILVHITKGEGQGLNLVSGRGKRPRPAPSGCVCVDLVRGRVAVHTVERRTGNNVQPYIHTTNLHGRMVTPQSHRLADGLATPGSFICLPRVGKPLNDKIARYEDSAEPVLSDCVFAVRPLAVGALGALDESVQRHFEELRDAYGGSCAPYLTVSRLADFLTDLGWVVKWVGASASPTACKCGAETFDATCITIPD